jgi:hypothetical protein
LYFIGYALNNYSRYPFLFTEPGFSSQEVAEYFESGYVNSKGEKESWRVLEVVFPEGYDSHCRKQRFYFDREELWLRRMDYVTDVAERIAAHYVFEHAEVKGIIVPMFRRVVGRVPDTGVAMVHGPTAFKLDYFDVDFQE